MFKLIGFDYGGVLFGEPGRVFDELVSKTIGVNTDKYRNAYFKFSHISEDAERWKSILKNLGKEELLSQLLSEIRNHSESKKLNEQVIGIVFELKHAGLRVGLLSNNSKEKADIMRQQGLDKIFDVFCVSSEIGYRKPDLRAFTYFTSLANANLSELLFIDDTPESVTGIEVKGATKIIFESPSQLRRDLKSLKLLTNRSNKP